jgi:hypothetical protein
MKNRIRKSVSILFMLVFLLSMSLTTQESIKKAPYCDTALMDCAEKCEAFYDEWHEKFAQFWCKEGCALGYLFC